MAEVNNRPSRLSQFFFLETTFPLLLLTVIVFGGLMAYQKIVKESNPDLAIGAASITTTWAGADSESVEQEITNPLERKIKTVKGLKRMSSGSYAGYSIISAEFYADVDPTVAMQRLRTKVSEAEAELPHDADSPSVVEASVSDIPILTFTLYGDIELSLLSQMANDLEKKIEKVTGVNEVNIAGHREEIIQIRLIGARLSALGIQPDLVKAAIQQANIDMPWGEFEGEDIGANFRFFGKFRDIEVLKQLPIKRISETRTIRLHEVADIKRGFEPESSRAFMSWLGNDYVPSLDISITKRPGADAIATIDNIKVLLEHEASQSSWPQSLTYRILSDQSEDIWDSLNNIFTNGWQAMLAVFIILFFSLTWREAIVAGLAIPLTFMMALLMVWYLGYTLNQIVIVGMVLALGLLVDVFILMMEGLHENLFVKGKTFNQSVMATFKAYVSPAFAGLLTTIFAMAPLMGIGGVEGKFIRAIPVTTIACLIASFIIALFIAVPLSRYLLDTKSKGSHQETTMDKVTAVYAKKLENLLASQFLVNKKRAGFWVAISVAIFLIGGMLFSSLPSEMMPKDDGRNLGISIEMSPDTSLDSAQVCADAIGETLKGQPYFESVTKLVGKKSPFSVATMTDNLTPNVGNYFVGFSAVFVPKEDRDMLGYEYVPQIRQLIQSQNASCPGSTVLLSPSTGGSTAEEPVQIHIIGDDINQLRDIALDVSNALSQVAGATDVHDNIGVARNDIKATPKQEALNFYGISPQVLAAQVRLMMESDEIGKFPLGGISDDLEIHMGYAWPSRNGEMGGATNLSEVYTMSVITDDGRSLPLLSVVHASIEGTSLTIIHRDGERTVTVKAKTNQRTASEILADFTPILDNMMQDWPNGYSYSIGGEAEASAEVFGSADVMMALALFLIFSMLVIQFDSFAQPFIIMSAIPLALTGMFYGFYILNLPFSFMAMIGVIALMGIVVNDSIVMLVTMNKHLKSGDSVAVSAAKGASERLRPIITTTVTTIAGIIPLGISQKMWMPLSVTVASGLLLSTFLALLIVPCLYMLFTPDKHGAKMARNSE